MEKIVHLEESALLDLILPAIECAVSPVCDGASEEGLEVGGVLWGHVSESRGRIVYTIRKCTILRLGEQCEGSIELPQHSIELMERVADAFWPSLDILGKFHTHPYMHLKEKKVVAAELYKFSDQDKRLFREIKNECMGIVVTVTKADRRRKGMFAEYVGGDNPEWSALMMEMNDLIVIIKCYVRSAAGRRSDNLLLFCPAVLGRLMSAGDIETPFIGQSYE